MKELKDFQIEKIHRRVSSVLVIFLGLVLVAGIAIVAKFGDLSFEKLNIAQKSKHNSQYEVRTISGVPTCLPLKSGDATTACEYGIKASDGKFYALSSGGSNPVTLYGEAGSADGLEISGEFIPASADEKFDIVGTIFQN